MGGRELGGICGSAVSVKWKCRCHFTERRALCFHGLLWRGCLKCFKWNLGWFQWEGCWKWKGKRTETPKYWRGCPHDRWIHIWSSESVQGAGKGKEKMTLIGRSDDSNQDEWDSIYEQKKICAGRREKPLGSSRSPLGTLLPHPFDQPSTGRMIQSNQTKGSPVGNYRLPHKGALPTLARRLPRESLEAVLVTVWALKVSRALLIHYK